MLIFQYCILNNHLYNQRLLYETIERENLVPKPPYSHLKDFLNSQAPPATCSPEGTDSEAAAGCSGQVFLKNLGHPPFGESIGNFC